MKRKKEPDTWSLIFLLIRMQGWLKGSMFALDDYGYENFRIKIKERYDKGSKSAIEMLNELGVSDLTLEMEIVAREAYDKCIELNNIIYELSPVLQDEFKILQENIELGELVYYGSIWANPKPKWYKA